MKENKGMEKQCILCERMFKVDFIRRRRYMKGLSPLPKLCPSCRGKIYALGEEEHVKMHIGDLPILPEYITIFKVKIKLQLIKDFFVLLFILLGMFVTFIMRDLFYIANWNYENPQYTISAEETVK